jgi:hypothetical protein
MVGESKMSKNQERWALVCCTAVLVWTAGCNKDATQDLQQSCDAGAKCETCTAQSPCGPFYCSDEPDVAYSLQDIYGDVHVAGCDEQ